VRVSADGARCCVASLWAHQITVVDVDASGKSLRLVRTIDLPFAPRLQLFAPGEKKLIVTDSFGGRLAVVDLARGEVESTRTLPAHNIRGLALDGDRLLVAHQVLNALAQTTRDDIHWGNVLTNNLRWLSLTEVLRPDADLLKGSEREELGSVGRGSGDPAGVALGPNGVLLVALAGVN